MKTKNSKKPVRATKKSPLLPYVIVRCSAAGVHAGNMVSQNGPVVVLRNSRRLWYWKVPMGAPGFLSGVSTHGISAESKIGCRIDGEHTLLDACEIIPCTEVAARLIQEAPNHVRTN